LPVKRQRYVQNNVDSNLMTSSFKEIQPKFEKVGGGMRASKQRGSSAWRVGADFTLIYDVTHRGYFKAILSGVLSLSARRPAPAFRGGY